MNFTVHKLSSILRHCILLSLYAVFFLVQFSCITGPDNTSIPVTSISFHQSIEKGKVFAAKEDRAKKTNLRLNKRFQPALAESQFNPLAGTPLKYISRDSLSTPKDYLLISFILATSLRGPPSLS
ncbi:MAG: hypothetical protein QM764_21525 [Chitinophagaceae bacterium]